MCLSTFLNFSSYYIIGHFPEPIEARQIARVHRLDIFRGALAIVFDAPLV